MAKVVHITSAHSADDVRIFKKECISLADAGHDVTLVAPSDDNYYERNIKIKAIKKAKSRIKRIVFRSFQAFTKAISEEAEIYHFHDPELIPYGLILEATGNKVIYDVHENLLNQLLEKRWLPKPLRSIFRTSFSIIEKISAPQFSGIIVTDETLYNKFQNYNPNTVIINNYPRLDEFGSDVDLCLSRYQQKRVVNFGGVLNTRVIREFVDSIELLSEEIEVILGGRIQSDDFLKSVREKNGWNKIHFKGSLPRNQMVECLKSASVGIVLYSNSGNHKQIRSNRLFESMAAGLPVIVPNFGEWNTFIDENECGLAVDPHSSKEISRAIEFLINNPMKAKKMGENGYRAALSRFSWKPQEEKLFSFYKKIISVT